jgi:hypothetical protein
MIIIYGLMPRRLYDIELGLIPGDKKLKHQIVTESACAYPVSVLISIDTHSSIANDQAISDSESSSGIPPIGAFPSTTSNTPAVDPSPSPPSPSPPLTLYHHGESAGSGDYMVDVLHPNRDSDTGEFWLHVDDETVSPMGHEDVFGEYGTERAADERCAYLIFIVALPR